MTARRITVELADDLPDSELRIVLAGLELLEAATVAVPIGAQDVVEAVRRRGQRRTIETIRARITDAVDQAAAELAAELEARKAAERQAERDARRRERTAARLREEILDSRP